MSRCERISEKLKNQLKNQFIKNQSIKNQSIKKSVDKKIQFIYSVYFFFAVKTALNILTEFADGIRTAALTVPHLADIG